MPVGPDEVTRFHVPRAHFTVELPAVQPLAIPFERRPLSLTVCGREQCLPVRRDTEVLSGGTPAASGVERHELPASHGIPHLHDSTGVPAGDDPVALR